jgi:hypothetical protein
MDIHGTKEMERIHDVCTYHIEVRDRVDENTFNESSPLRITVVRVDPIATLLTVCADQSGLIGLIRHLHGQGFVLLSVFRGP